MVDRGTTVAKNSTTISCPFRSINYHGDRLIMNRIHQSITGIDCFSSTDFEATLLCLASPLLSCNRILCLGAYIYFSIIIP